VLPSQAEQTTMRATARTPRSTPAPAGPFTHSTGPLRRTGRIGLRIILTRGLLELVNLAVIAMLPTACLSRGDESDCTAADPTCDTAAARDAEAPRPRLGAQCQRDTDCPPGAFCLNSASEPSLGGTFASATCVADCSEDRAACDGYPGAACVEIHSISGGIDAGGRSRALCFESCTIGDPSESKCHAAPRVACEPLGPDGALGYCRPVCILDADCSAGVCDRRSGLCVPAEEAPAATLAFGAPCDPTASGACPGLCVSLTEGYSVCSHRCVFGMPGECADETAEPPRGGCLFVTPGGTLGDVGFCAALCDCGSTCEVPPAVCDPLGDLEEAFGSSGVCTPPDLALGEAPACN
jgi:hypothetical protein